MSIEPNITVGELALEIPGATRIFEKVGIDYCCGGKRSLGEACSIAGVSVEEMMTSLQFAGVTQPRTRQPTFLDASLSELIDHIVEEHHAFTRTEIHRLLDLLNKVCIAHGPHHSELGKLKVLFETLSDELEPHMLKEERVLFPYVIGMEEAIRNSRSVPTPPFGSVANPVRRMMTEHDNAGELLKQMRLLTSNYTTPPDVCYSYHTLYQALAELEKDLHQHIHLENNILFPRAIELEDAFLK
jgi:regulator of cell morphogenesis and NO signaling